MSSTSQSDHIFPIGDFNIDLLDPIPNENDFINNCHLNSLIPNQLYDTFNGIFLLDITDHYPILCNAPTNCPQKRICLKFWDNSGQNVAKLKTEVKHHLNNHVRINKDVNSNTNNLCNNLFFIYSNCCSINEK